MIIVGAVVALGLEYLRSRSLAEFPDVQFDVDVDGVKNSVAKTWTTIASRFSNNDAGDHVAQLQKLSEMHASGALSDAEYTAAKAKLLN